MWRMLFLLTARRSVTKPMGQLHDIIANMIVITNVAYDCQNYDILCADCDAWSTCISLYKQEVMLHHSHGYQFH